jgi:hypothetical protein
MSPEQEQKLNEIYAFMQSLKANSTIPIEVDGAFRTRLTGILGLTVSAKSANSEDVSVNEAGAASYSVMNDPVGFLEVDIDSVTYYIPYFT